MVGYSVSPFGTWHLGVLIGKELDRIPSSEQLSHAGEEEASHPNCQPRSQGGPVEDSTVGHVVVLCCERGCVLNVNT